MNERITIRQVARTAGVSVATVSRVLTGGTAAVSEALRRRVEEAAQALDYTPHPVARSLALGRTSVVGVLVPNLANPYVCGLTKRILHEAERADHRLIVADSDEKGDEVLLGVSLLQRGDGLIVFSPRGDLAAIDSLADHGKPVVIVNRPGDSPKLSSVVVEGHQAMTALARHVADLGHRSVAYLHGPARAWEDGERWRALASVLTERDVELVSIEAHGRLSDGHDAVPVALDAGCTAIMCFNDLTALGVLAGLRERGVRVPEEISVTGFGDVTLARCVCPTLTSAHGRQVELAVATWRILAEMLDGGQPGTHATLTAEAVFRGSTGPAPAG